MSKAVSKMPKMSSDSNGKKCRLSDCCLCLSTSLSSLKKDGLTDFWRKKQSDSLEVRPAVGQSTGGIELQEEIVNERSEDITKSACDVYTYRYIELVNGVKILLASNPNSTTSGAALDIRVGSFYDPVHLQGLCHLCEHVLFTGSEKYPGEGYSTFLSDHGGSSNAFTTAEHTNFHFEIPSLHFFEAISRFAAFFECPILRQCSVQNELEMVHSEHEKNRFNDVWRTNQVERATADPNHAFSRFSTGSRQTLEISHSSDRNLRYEVFTFYKTHYSGNLMAVSLFHNLPLDELEAMAKTAFGNIRNKNIPERIWPSRPFKRSQMKVKIFVVPVKDVRHLNLTFPCEDMSNHYSAAPDGFIAQLVGHKGPGGLFSYLRKEGLAHHLIASPRILGRGCAFFVVTVQLTEIGERKLDDVILIVFQYFKLIRSSVQSLKWFFDELQFLSKQQFENKEIEQVQTHASNVAGWLHLYPPKDVLVGSFVYSDWKPDLIERVFCFLVPDNVRVTILTKKAKYFATQVEPHYGSDFHVEKIPKDVLALWRSCPLSQDLAIPDPNELIDEEEIKIEVVTRDERRTRFYKQPELFLLLNRVRIKAWYLRDTMFMLKKSFLYLKFSSECASDTATQTELMNLWVLLIQDYMTEYAYNGQLAGIFYSLMATKNGMELQIRGQSGKQHLFLRKILSAIYSMDFQQSRFKQVYDVHCKSLSSWEVEPLKRQVKHFLSHILSERTHTKADRLKAARQIKFEEIEPFARGFLLDNSLECFYFGCLTPEQADMLSSIVIEERTKFVEKWVHEEEVQVTANPYLEEWFLSDPVEKLTSLENALITKLKKDDEEILESEKASLSEENGIIKNLPEEGVVKIVCDDLTVSFEKGINNCFVDIRNNANLADSNENLNKATLDLNLQPVTIENEDVEDEEEEDNYLEIVPKQERKSSRVSFSQLRLHFEQDEVDEHKGIRKKDYLERRVINKQSLFIIHNEVQSASCVQFFFDCSEAERTHLQILLHLIRVNVVEFIKLTMALGYVVDCSIRKVGNNHGIRIIVQSQYPLEVVYNTIESAVDIAEALLTEMTSEAYTLSREAMITNMMETELGIFREVANILWLEIAEQTYNFKRTESDINEINGTTLEQVNNVYRDFLKSDGAKRRLIIISVGPDAILNRIEQKLIRHWTMNEVEKFRHDCTVRQEKIDDEKMAVWFQSVFDAKESEYSPPFFS